MTTKKFETAVFGSGCFWCAEAMFSQLRGVESVKSGYAGGARPNPTYEGVSTGVTGHAEVIQIIFDPSVISYDALLDVFFHTHDSTSLNRQGNDAGPQYRSTILYASPEQKKAAEAFIQKLIDEKEFDKPIVTELKPLDAFYEAEGYHQNYYKNNAAQPYCQFVISPKMAHFRKRYAYLTK